MKKSIFALFLIVTGVAGSVEAALSIPAGQPQISVFGVVEKRVVPDTMNWELQVNTNRATIQEAATAHLVNVSRVLALLKELGVRETDTATSQMQIVENWLYRQETRVMDGYTAGTRISFSIIDFKQYILLWTKLAAFKNLQIIGVNFSLSSQKKLQQELRSEALVAARKKAEKMAATLGCTVGAPLLIEEGGNMMAPTALNRVMAAPVGGSSDSRGATSPGEQVVRSTVHAVFLLEQSKGQQ